jgi:putative nucleotidyltransferase with HDIG domain
MHESWVARVRRCEWFHGLRPAPYLFPAIVSATALTLAVVLLVRDFRGAPALVLLLLTALTLGQALRRNRERHEDIGDFSAALAGMIAEVDPYTRRHSLRVAAYAEQLARGLGLPEKRVRQIRLAGLLHDLGKVGQERAVLQKPGALDPAERRRMEAHPVAGAEIIRQVRGLEEVAVLVRHHHERPDGGGYPARLAGDAIPLGSRVVLIADAFDAMTSDRPYRKGMPGDRAVAELRRHAGKQFDARVVETLARMREQGDFEIIHHGPPDRRDLPERGGVPGQRGLDQPQLIQSL